MNTAASMMMFGALVAGGIWLLGQTFRDRPVRVRRPGGHRGSGVAVATLRVEGVASRRTESWTEPWMTSISDRLGLSQQLIDDLRIARVTQEALLLRVVSLSLVSFVSAVVVLSIVFPLLGFTVVPVVAVALAIGAAALGAGAPIRSLRTEAARRRHEFAAAVGHYVLLIDVMVSGGQSIDSAFELAADLGEGWPWEELRFAVAAASRAAEPPHVALAEVARDLGVPELDTLARRFAYTQASGAAIGPALRSLADASAKDHARRIKIADDEVTEKMTFPQMVVLTSLLTFFGIAAVHAILSAASSL